MSNQLTQNNPYPHQFEWKLVPTVSVETLIHSEFQCSMLYLEPDEIKILAYLLLVHQS